MPPRKKRAHCLLVTGLILYSFSDAKARVSVTLLQPPPNQMALSELWRLSLQTTRTALDVQLELQIQEREYGLIVEAESSRFVLPPGLTTKALSGIGWPTVHFRNEKFKQLLSPNGSPPPGNYTVCVSVKTQREVHPSSRSCIRQTIDRTATTEIKLLNPTDAGSIDPKSTTLFSWVPVKGRENVTYVLRIVQINKPEERTNFDRKPSWFYKAGLNIAHHSHASSERRFEQGCIYAWQVKAYSVDRELLAQSSVGMFRGKGAEEKPPFFNDPQSFITIPRIELVSPYDAKTLDRSDLQLNILELKWRWRDPGGTYNRQVKIFDNLNVPHVTADPAEYPPDAISFHLRVVQLMPVSQDSEQAIDQNPAWYEGTTSAYDFNPNTHYVTASYKLNLINRNFGGKYAWRVTMTVSGMPKEFSDVSTFDSPRYPPILTMTCSTCSYGDQYKPNDPAWASHFVGGQTWLSGDTPPFEWMPILDGGREDGKNVGISGWAVKGANDGISNGDMPFTHPFGFDWEFYIVPDPGFYWLLAASNNAKTGEYHDAISQAGKLGLSAPRGVLGVETDLELVPSDYRINDGDRVGVLGRWVVDAGHDDFHTEFHPPLLLGHSTRWSDDATVSRFISNPYLVGQTFDDGPMLAQLKHEAEVAVIVSLDPFDLIGPYCLYQTSAHPKILRPSFSQPYDVRYTIRPPTPRNSPHDKLKVSYWFVVRSTITIALERNSDPMWGQDAIDLVIHMDPASELANEDKRAKLPDKSEPSWSLQDLANLHPEISGPVAFTDYLSGHLNPHLFCILSKGIKTDFYTVPARSGAEGQWNVFYLDGGNVPQAQIIVDNSQPFPIYGDLDIQWERQP